jgi:hypothetical protein
MVRLVPTLVTKVARSTGTAHPRADSAGRHEVKVRKGRRSLHPARHEPICPPKGGDLRAIDG